MKLDQLKTNRQLIAEDLASDPEFRAEWERTALARAVALCVLRYRTENKLSQSGLAAKLGMKQPQVARLEQGDVNPSIETLGRLSAGLEIEFSLSIHPADRPATLVKKRAAAGEGVALFELAGAGVSLAAA